MVRDCVVWHACLLPGQGAPLTDPLPDMEPTVTPNPMLPRQRPNPAPASAFVLAPAPTSDPVRLIARPNVLSLKFDGDFLINGLPLRLQADHPTQTHVETGP